MSVLLAAAALVGYAVVTSPMFQGPFAEPRPSVAPPARATVVPITSYEPAAFQSTIRCALPGSAFGTTVFINGATVPFERPIALSPWSCGKSANHAPLPYDRVAR